MTSVCNPCSVPRSSQDSVQHQYYQVPCCKCGKTHYQQQTIVTGSIHKPCPPPSCVCNRNTCTGSGTMSNQTDNAVDDVPNRDVAVGSSAKRNGLDFNVDMEGKMRCEACGCILSYIPRKNSLNMEGNNIEGDPLGVEYPSGDNITTLATVGSCKQPKRHQSIQSYGSNGAIEPVRSPIRHQNINGAATNLGCKYGYRKPIVDSNVSNTSTYTCLCSRVDRGNNTPNYSNSYMNTLCYHTACKAVQTVTSSGTWSDGSLGRLSHDVGIQEGYCNSRRRRSLKWDPPESVPEEATTDSEQLDHGISSDMISQQDCHSEPMCPTCYLYKHEYEKRHKEHAKEKKKKRRCCFFRKKD